ncbi:ADP-ribosyl cyclase/cyclic ADP-ribose hydrolase 1-like isoform X2 [Acanthopagrus latus]|uniref:ADP-ribosyl cyclase/cyclic ADP-ribose hydrolase 1-like isoform X2 n=1 Tax=Acanthopagrus latus TaxID=8177 RepID=UPI00187C36D3|nr:ADP-ribosyl cyclase/cyclic ADP-ribose hydrolase 1-like isoform X2 [Acanthopagrus latus]
MYGVQEGKSNKVEIMTTSYTAVQIQTHGGRNEDTVSVHVPDTETEPPQNKRRWIGGTIAVTVVAAIIAVVIWRTCQPETFSKRFIRKCLEYKKDNNESYCQHVFDVFERAYVGKPESKVSVEDYDDLMAEVPFNHPCHQTMFWSKTNELVHKYTKDKGKKDCFTQEDALLGNILDNETWCGKEGSNETFTDGCQGLNYTGNTAVLSFWNRASAAFAEYACGEVTVMLDGSLEIPFNPNSTFARVEIRRLKYPKVTKLNVILVTGDKNVSNCNADNLKIDLRKALDSNILYSCNEVTESRVADCSSSSDTDVGCVACLLKPTE